MPIRVKEARRAPGSEWIKDHPALLEVAYDLDYGPDSPIGRGRDANLPFRCNSQVKYPIVVSGIGAHDRT